ncbi:SDR family NAD(P)-dependent oxidoreductase [Rhizobium sp. 32-5/1]|uniref:SDR family NAD(P)-dependent oxidoreductase n=1 Tax=Rhizobium sp. 32-5/1 TaxID=3019602 RepID=UPI00240E03C8|nr:SDR family NAD(P)-dependent oxidoreductase [Rhizobium sp. 32-5/1]WEZ82843.1 SDR family NAD(P)-dependent oxidoreductase [Rhizobium sp. 32-5/1]
MSASETGRTALVIGASGGIGSAVVAALKAGGRYASVVTLSRSQTGLDVTDETTIRQASEEVRDIYGPVDLVFDATGGLEIGGQGPEKTIRAIDPAAMARQFALNAIGPALLLKHFSPLLAKDRLAVFATLSARVGSIGDNRLGGWISYRAAKAALNQIVRTSAIEIGRSHPQAVVVALHPGTVDTKLSAKFSRNHEVFWPSQAAEQLLAVVDGLDASQTGSFLAYDGSVIEW